LSDTQRGKDLNRRRRAKREIEEKKEERRRKGEADLLVLIIGKPDALTPFCQSRLFGFC
jgi:hypothetical protein